MKLFTEKQKTQLIKNHKINEELYEKWEDWIDFKPVVKLFWWPWTWLLSELDPITNIAFGVADLSLWFCEAWSVGIDELQELKIPNKMIFSNWDERVFYTYVERDLFFTPHKPLTEYIWDWEIDYN